MHNLINKEAAIEHWRRIIDATSTDSEYNMGFVDGLEFCISHLSTMPSVQPERKTGRWIVYYECPKCGEITKDFTEYCLFCNADMRGEEDE